MSRLLPSALLAAALASLMGDAPRQPSPAPEAPATLAKPETDGFASRVKPVLARTCTPCHVPGGSMYERLPFDKAETVLAKKEGILRRLKGEDRQAVEAWLAAQK